MCDRFQQKCAGHGLLCSIAGEVKDDRSCNQSTEHPLVVINVGLEKFAKELETQGVEVTRVDWQPPAGGDQEMIDILDLLL